MIRLFEFLWHGCWHRWGDPVGSPTRHYLTGDERTYMHTTQFCRCKKCGRFKRMKVPE